MPGGAGTKRWALGGPILVLVACVALIFSNAKPASAAPPPGFEDRFAANVPAPTATAFTPDGRLLVTSQPGKLHVREGTGAPTVALDVSGKTCSGRTERGMLGVAVDPDFAANNFVYVYYTENRSGACVNRVSRFTLPASNTVDPGSEAPVIANIPSPSCCHQGGDIHFGNDGNLYVSVGDGATQGGQLAQTPSSLLGKILRVTPTATGYDIPSGNPFTGSDSVRCGGSGGAATGPPCGEVFALGLRNPFRMAFDPNASGTRFFINDVGQNTWEEVDEGRSGANYGWPQREGPCAQGSTTNCGTVPAFTNPVHSYQHGTGCRSITGGAFVPDGLWTGYDGSYLFADFVCDTVFRLSPNTVGGFSGSVFAGCLGSPTSLTFGPATGSAGTTRGLYYTTYANGGQVRLILQTGSTAQQPPCPPPPPPNTSAPVILSPRPAPGASIRDRRPRVTAIVRDAQTDLAKNNIRLYFDGRLRKTFSYDRAANRLTFVPQRLAPGRHGVRIAASDGQGRQNARSWTFKVRR